MKWLQRILYFFCVRCQPGRAKTVSYTFSVLILVTGVTLIASLLSSDTSFMRIVSSVDTIEAGKPFKVEVYAKSHVPVNAVDITLGFSSEHVVVREIDTGLSVITLWTTPPRVEGEEIVFRGGTFRKGFLGEHLIASVDFEAKVGGQAVFTLNDVTLLAGDGSGSNVAVETPENELVVAVVTKDGEMKAKAEVLVVSDTNGDGAVDFKDIQRFIDAWQNSSVLYDFNNDNKMNFTDFAIILARSFAQ